MAAEVVWLDDAKDDVREILDYIAADNPSAAASYVLGITDACGKLSEFPEAGSRYNAEYRKIIFRNHIIFYRFDEQANCVRITAVIDGRRDMATMVGDKD